MAGRYPAPLAASSLVALTESLIAFLAGSRTAAELPTVTHLRQPLMRRNLTGPDFGFDMFATIVNGRLRGPAPNLFRTQLRAANWSSDAA